MMPETEGQKEESKAEQMAKRIWDWLLRQNILIQGLVFPAVLCICVILMLLEIMNERIMHVSKQYNSLSEQEKGFAKLVLSMLAWSIVCQAILHFFPNLPNLIKSALRIFIYITFPLGALLTAIVWGILIFEEIGD